MSVGAVRLARDDHDRSPSEPQPISHDLPREVKLQLSTVMFEFIGTAPDGLPFHVVYRPNAVRDILLADVGLLLREVAAPCTSPSIKRNRLARRSGRMVSIAVSGRSAAVSRCWTSAARRHSAVRGDRSYAANSSAAGSIRATGSSEKRSHSPSRGRRVRKNCTPGTRSKLSSSSTSTVISSRAIGFAFAANTLVIVVLQLFVLRRIEGVRRTRVIAVMGLVWAGAGAPGRSGLVPGTLGASLLVAACASMFAFGETMLQPTIPALMNDLAPDHLRGRYNAVSSASFSSPRSSRRPPPAC